MNSNPNIPTALLAEDEPLLAQALLGELRKAWPELAVRDTVGDGHSALKRALELQPDVLFFDIRMPGLSGIDAAVALADEWDNRLGGKPFPVLIFVTAYDQYAVQAFEAQALDYVLKPVEPARLARTVAKAKEALRQRQFDDHDPRVALQEAVNQLRGLVASPTAGPSTQAQPRLQVIQASVSTANGTRIDLVPVADVVYIEAADKYLRVLTREQEYLIRTSLRELQAQLDPDLFWQIHRGTVVRCTDIGSVLRDDAGRLSVSLRSRSERLSVSRLYAHLFKAM